MRLKSQFRLKLVTFAGLKANLLNPAAGTRPLFAVKTDEHVSKEKNFIHRERNVTLPGADRVF